MQAPEFSPGPRQASSRAVRCSSGFPASPPTVDVLHVRDLARSQALGVVYIPLSPFRDHQPGLPQYIGVLFIPQVSVKVVSRQTKMKNQPLDARGSCPVSSHQSKYLLIALRSRAGVNFRRPLFRKEVAFRVSVANPADWAGHCLVLLFKLLLALLVSLYLSGHPSATSFSVII